METKEVIKISGQKLNLEIIARDKFGKIKDRRLISNTITYAGLAEVAGLLNGATSGPFDYIAVGTGTTGASTSDTTLETEITDSGLARAQGTASRITTAQTNDTAQVTKTFSVTGTKAVTEAGLLDAASSGVLLARQTFSAINVVSGDSLQMTWKIQVS